MEWSMQTGAFAPSSRSERQGISFSPPREEDAAGAIRKHRPVPFRPIPPFQTE